MLDSIQTEEDTKRIYKEIIDASPYIALRIADSSADWRILFVTKNISISGYSRHDFITRKINFFALAHPDDRAELTRVMQEFQETGNNKHTVIYRLMRKDGSFLWVAGSITVIRDQQGGVRYFDCVLMNYTHTRDHIERLRQGYRQQSVLTEILQGIHDADLDKALQIILERSGEYLDVSRVVLYRNSEDNSYSRIVQQWRNPKWEQISADTRIYRYNTDVPELDDIVRRSGYRIVTPGESADKTAEQLRREGVLTSAIFAINIQEQPFGFLRFDECVKPRRWSRDTTAFLHNVAKLVPPVIFRQRSERLIRELVITDQLTGLRNRRHLESCLADAIDRAEKEGGFGYVLFIGMDDFKIINDAYGHDYGDAVLKEVSAFLSGLFDDGNHVYRFAGDEFVILVEGEEIQSVASRIMKRAQLPWQVLGRALYCTLSIGAARFPMEAVGDCDVLKNAGIAMYEAKKKGKSTLVHYRGGSYKGSVERAEMENAMRESIDNGFRGFDVHYQPLTSLDRNIIGAEALVRWTLDGKKLSPVEFIPLAEYLGLIVPLGDHILSKAARCCREINRKHPKFFMAVNASIRQFRHAGFLENAVSLLNDACVDKRNITLEITEGMAIHDMQSMKDAANELRRHGISISMDDFGTGYSSLGSMRDLPIDVVKIDRTFIRDVTTDAYSESFVRLIIDLVHSMRRRVCVEGVETEEQLAYCQRCGADYVQGFFLHRPMPKQELLWLLE